MFKVLSLLPEPRFTSAGVKIPDKLQVEFLTNYAPEAIIEAAKGKDGLFVPPSHPRLTAEILEKLTDIKMIQSAGAGFDSVDHQAAAKLGLAVCNSPAQNATTVAEFVLSAIISLQRETAYADAHIKAGHYSEVRERILQRGCLEIFGSTVGIVGFGAIGRALVPYLKAFGANIVAQDVYWNEEFAKEHGVRRVELDDLFYVSDVITLHCPLMDSTRGLVDAARLAMMKPNAVLVNAARGGIVIEKDLAEALEKGIIRGAAIDNFESEIPDSQNPLLNLSPGASRNVLFTPHLAGVTLAAFSRMLRQGMANMADSLSGASAPRFSINGVSTIRGNA